MPKLKADHVVMRNDAMFCTHCGREQKIPMPCEIPVFSAMAKAFAGSHANCEKVWEQPTIDQELPERQKAAFWFAYGERGVSSETMYGVFSGKGVRNDGCHPWDPADFRRCHGLLEMVPEWRGRLSEMKDQSKAWSNLVDNWDKLTEMLLEQMRTRQPNGMYELMQKCINDEL